MKKIKITTLLLAAFAVVILSSCTQELDLDEETLLLLEKQDKLEKLDELFELAFTDPSKASDDYDRYFAEELLRDGQNFLVDNDIRMRATFTDLAIRLNSNFDDIKAGEIPTSLFKLYEAKFRSIMFNRSLLGEIPQQIRKGDKLSKFESRVDEVTAFYETRINNIKNSEGIDQNLLGKQWKAMQFAVKPDYSAFLVLYYDFNFVADGTLDIEQFTLYPLWDRQGSMTYTAEESANYPEDIAGKLLSEPAYVAYDNKILFYFHLESNPNAADLKFNREWLYEFDYVLDGNTLTLSNPRVMRFMHPLLYIGGYGLDSYEEYYFEDLRSFTLTAE